MVKFINTQIEGLFLIDNDPIIVIDTTCQIRTFNDCAAQLFNLTANETYDLQLDELSKLRWNSFVYKLRKQMVGYCNLKIRIGTSDYKDVRLIGHLNENENLMTAKILLKEVEESTQISKNNDILISSFNEISNGVIISDIDGVVIDVNNVVLENLNCERADVIHLPVEHIFSLFSNYHIQKVHYIRTLRSSGSAMMELTKENELGEENYYKVETKFNFVKKNFVSTITDITETVTLKKQIESQKYLCSVGEMSASIVHEIRNPMTSLKGFLDLMKMNCKDENKRYLQIMDLELKRMETMLSDLLYLSKPTEQKMDRVLIYKVMNDVLELMQQNAIKNNVVIQLNVVKSELRVMTVYGNETRLKQLFINLIKNAIEVMDCGGMITIELNESSSKNYQVSIRDEGVGMTDDERKQLFTPFYTTKEKGTGLGLALVKKVVDEHQGSINVESTLGVGTTFTIDFPISPGNSRYEQDENETWINNDSVTLPVI